MQAVYLVLISVSFIFHCTSLLAASDDLTRDHAYEAECAFQVALSRVAAEDDLPTQLLGLRMMARVVTKQGYTALDPAMNETLFKLVCSKNEKCRTIASWLIATRGRDSISNPKVESFLTKLLSEEITITQTKPDEKSALAARLLIFRYLSQAFDNPNPYEMGMELKREIFNVDLKGYHRNNIAPPLVQLKIWALRKLAKRGDKAAAKMLLKLAKGYADFSLVWGVPDPEAIRFTLLSIRAVVLPKLEDAQFLEKKYQERFVPLSFWRSSAFYTGEMEAAGAPSIFPFVPLRTIEGELIELSVAFYLELAGSPKMSAPIRIEALEALSTIVVAELDEDVPLTTKLLGLLDTLKSSGLENHPRWNEEFRRKISQALRLQGG